MPGEKVVFKNVNEAASYILEQTLFADEKQTFPVAGAIVNNNTGELIASMHNNVIKPLDKKNNIPFTFDPTAHGERQLVYWYYEHKDDMNLPAPGDLTIITSLDPCAMCTGALLTAGFNAGVIAIDDFAGINYDSKFGFYCLSQDLKAAAQEKFGYYAAGSSNSPVKYTRAYCGGENVIFKDQAISSVNLAGCSSVFLQKVNKVRSDSNTGRKPGSMKDPALLPDDSPVKKAFRRVYPDAFKIKTGYYRNPGKEIIAELQKVYEQNKGAGNGNAAAFIDPFGNLVLCLADSTGKNPVKTAFMEITRNYAMIRWNLKNDYVKDHGDDPDVYLTHPGYGTFVFLFSPDAEKSSTIMDIGAFGSTMEGNVPLIYPSNIQYCYNRSPGNFYRLVNMINNLPPFYSKGTQINFMRIPFLHGRKDRV